MPPSGLTPSSFEARPPLKLGEIVTVYRLSCDMTGKLSLHYDGVVTGFINMDPEGNPTRDGAPMIALCDPRNGQTHQEPADRIRMLENGCKIIGNHSAAPIWDIRILFLEGMSDPVNCGYDEPFDIWGTGLGVEMIYECLGNEKLMVSDPVAAAERDPMIHAGKIAWFFKNGWNNPIEIDVGIPGVYGDHDEWLITDGNHRLAAAIMRGDETIKARISGDLDHAREILMPDCDPTQVK